MLGSHPHVYVPAESHFIPYVYREYQRSGTFPLEWFFDEDAAISEYPWPDEYVAAPRSEAAAGFGGILRWLSLFYGLDRRELAAFLDGKPRYSDIVMWIFDSALKHDVLVCNAEDKDHYGDKTPHYVREIAALREIFPEAVMISVVRDGRAVLCSKSIRKRHLKPDTQEVRDIESHLMHLCPNLNVYTAVKTLEGEVLDSPEARKWIGLPTDITLTELSAVRDLIQRLGELWKDSQVVTTVEPGSVTHKARVWASDVRSGFDADLIVRYEDLVFRTESTLQRVCQRLGIDMVPQMLRYYENRNLLLFYSNDVGDWPGNRDILRPPVKDNVDKWRRLLKPSVVTQFDAVAGRELRLLGYK
jgi:hypothetical protein